MGTVVKKTETVDEEDERRLWESGVLNVDTPSRLFNCVFYYYNGKNFCLLGGEEHRSLKLSQIKREEVIVQKKLLYVTHTQSMDQRIVLVGFDSFI